MSEDQDLMMRIGRLAGHINLHKTQITRGSSTRCILKRSISAPSVPRTKPPERARKPIYYPHKNRSLVVNKEPHPVPRSDSIASSAGILQPDCDKSNISTKVPTTWVSKRDRHMQLINSSVFNNKIPDPNHVSQSITTQIHDGEGTLVKQYQQRGSYSAKRYCDTSMVYLNEQVPKIGINDATFEGGNEDSERADPHSVVDELVFSQSSYKKIRRPVSQRAAKTKAGIGSISERCKRFAMTGRCARGSRCPYIHDPVFVALCKDFLQKGLCPAGDFCDLSHDLSPERTPTCLHFLRGRCSNISCRYLHVRLSPSASVCCDFAIFGYCKKGTGCSERHVHECPAYANAGTCPNQNCHLPHPDSAGQIRQHKTKNASGMRLATNIHKSIGDIDATLKNAAGCVERSQTNEINNETNFVQLHNRHLKPLAEQEFCSDQDFVQF